MARSPGSKAGGGSFDEATIEAVWKKGTPEPGYTGFSKDACGASMQRPKHGKTGSGGGKSTTSSLSPRGVPMTSQISSRSNGRTIGTRVMTGRTGRHSVPLSPSRLAVFGSAPPSRVWVQGRRCPFGPLRPSGSVAVLRSPVPATRARPPAPSRDLAENARAEPACWRQKESSRDCRGLFQGILSKGKNLVDLFPTNRREPF